MWNLFGLLLEVNMSDFFTETFTFFKTPFEQHIGNNFWIGIFMVFVGITYGLTKSVGSVLFVILLIFGLFGTLSDLVTSPEVRLFSSILAAASLAGLVLSLFIKKQGV